jgi:crotonobetainyl-CoA:carnitine CoA-transferase CaiB-like acyl-CoA transferase
VTTPLIGIRILDFSRVLAGPLATMILGDLGAEVIKVERPIAGDDSRSWGPPFDERGESAYYLSCNRNKLSVSADLNDPSDIRLLGELAAAADVIVDNFLPGTLERYGLDPTLLLAAHPNLIWCTITGFGADSARPGYDYVVQAESGWMSITGEVGRSPMKVGVALADVIAGKDAAIAILAALAGKRRGTPIERRVFVSLYHSAVGALVNVAQNALVTRRDAVRWGNAHPNLVPYETFPASDRDVVIAVGNDAQFAALVAALDLPVLAGVRYSTNAGRVLHREDVVNALRARLATAPAAHWIALLDRAGVPSGVVRSVLEALADVSASAATGVAPQSPGTIRRPPPMLDQHGAVIRARGWDAFLAS